MLRALWDATQCSAYEVTRRILKTRYGIILALALLLPLAAVGVSGGSVFAQSYCSVQVGTETATTQYYESNSYGSYSSWNIQLTLPVSASCQNMGGSLWAVGNAYDTVANTNVGSADTAINSNGGYNGGQLVFTLPPSVVEHPLQISITVYSNYNNGQYGSVVGSTSQTVTIHSNSYSTPTYPYNNSPTYPSYPSYYNGYPMYYYYYNGNYYYYYPSSYYHYYPSYQQVSGCYNGQAIVYYNGAYYYVSCYQYYHHHH